MKEIFRCVYGSKLFGSSLSTSDDDFRSVVIPSCKDILLQQADKIRQTESRERANVAGDVDVTQIPVSALMRLLLSSEVTAIETLFAPALVGSREWDLITSRRSELVSSNVSKFAGFGLTQIKRYASRAEDLTDVMELIRIISGADSSRKLSKNEDVMNQIRQAAADNPGIRVYQDPKHENVTMVSAGGKAFPTTDSHKNIMTLLNGIMTNASVRAKNAAVSGTEDTKALYHAIRIMDEAIELLETGELRFPLRFRSTYLDIRSGVIDRDRCRDMFDEKSEIVKALKASSRMPSAVSQDVTNEIIIELYGETVLAGVQASADPPEYVSP